MGQKVNPVGFRLGVNRGWDSVWYAKKKDFGNYLIEDFKIREYIIINVMLQSIPLDLDLLLEKKEAI
jgi:small subunit ribosomal protein S3